MDPSQEKRDIRLPLTERGAEGNVVTGITPEIIRAVVDDFYAKCREHPELGPIFNARVEDWDGHLARIRDFWEAAILRTGRYAGRPLEAHLAIPDLGREHFSAWLRLFSETVAAHCSKEDAAIFMDRAGRMANRLMAAGNVGSSKEKRSGAADAAP